MSKDIEKIESLKSELSAWHESFGTTQLTHALAERERLKSENARLAAEADSIIEELSHHWSTHRNEFDRFNLVQQRITAFRSGERAVLRDLLAPTISFLEDVIHYEQYPKMGCFTATAKQEIARLRAACGEKGEK